MDLNNINDIEVLREAAKAGRVQLKKNIDTLSKAGNKYTFKKDYWYLMEQEEFYLHIFTDDFTAEEYLTYEEADEYIY
jgi:hypothetical protein